MVRVRTTPYLQPAMTDKIIHHGRFVWRELMTPDVDASKAFYGEVFNWKINEVDMGPMKYPMISVDGNDQGGIVKIDQPGMPPHWRGFVSVNDVDAGAKTAAANGGKVVFGPETMGPGRVAMLIDPAGAGIALWHSLEGDKPLPEQPALGEFCWEDLMTPDAGTVTDFYNKVVGWDVEPFPGNDGIKVFKADGAMAGGINTMAPKGTPPHWLSYVVVDSLAEARGRVERLGGKIMLEEMPVGEFGKIAIAQDNVGAGIGLFQSTGG